MKLRTVLLPVTLLMAIYSCNAQNGPTPPSVALSWTQSVGSTKAIAKNCVYRGTITKVYALPALYCSTTPVTTYTDLTVKRGTVYFYAVTAQDVNGAESDYSQELAVTSPIINAPSGLATTLISLVAPNYPHYVAMLQTPNGRLRAVVH